MELKYNKNRTNNKKKKQDNLTCRLRVPCARNLVELLSFQLNIATANRLFCFVYFEVVLALATSSLKSSKKTHTQVGILPNFKH